MCRQKTFKKYTPLRCTIRIILYWCVKATDVIILGILWSLAWYKFNMSAFLRHQVRLWIWSFKLNLNQVFSYVIRAGRITEFITSKSTEIVKEKKIDTKSFPSPFSLRNCNSNRFEVSLFLFTSVVKIPWKFLAVASN